MKVCAFDTETDGLYYFRGHKPFLCAVVDVDNIADVRISSIRADGTFTNNDVRDILEDASVEKVAHNCKFDLHMLKAIGVDVRGVVHDSMVLASLRNEYEPSLKLEALVKRYLRRNSPRSVELKAFLQANAKRFREIYQREITYRDVPDALIHDYIAEDVVSCAMLFKSLRSAMQEFGTAYETEIQLIRVLVQLERRGVCVDVDKLNLQARSIYPELAKNLKQLRAMISEPSFNPNSPQQVIRAAQKRGVDLPRNKGGGATTQQKLMPDCDDEFMLQLFKYRELSTTLSTFLFGLKELQVGGVVHAQFWVGSSSKDTAVKTHRLASSNPNLQNIPTRSTDVVRSAFVPRPGYTFVFFDYVQIEMVLFIHTFGCERLAEIVNSGGDLHGFTAMQVFEMNEGAWAALKARDRDKWDRMRFIGKQVNFSIIYGGGINAVARGGRATRSQAKRWLDAYHKANAEVSAAMRASIKRLENEGHAVDVFGRKYHVPMELSYKAANAVIQGAAATVLKRAMVRSYDMILREGFDAWPLLTIHDEIMYEVKTEQIDRFVAACKPELLADSKLFMAPLAVDVSVANERWSEKRKL